MKLYYTANSPYARRARMAVREAGLLPRVEEIDITPREENLDRLLEAGPGGKVPMLVTDAGAGLCESLLISRYIDDVSGGTLYPAETTAREHTLVLESIGSVLMDATFVRSREGRRASEEQSDAVFELESSRAQRCYGALEARIEATEECLDAGIIAVIAALGYADWRAPDDGWRDRCPALAAWYERMLERPAAVETRPDY